MSNTNISRKKISNLFFFQIFFSYADRGVAQGEEAERGESTKLWPIGVRNESITEW